MSASAGPEKLTWRALVAETATYPKIFAVHENHRYRPWFQRILQLHCAGFFGAVQFVRFEHLNPTAPNEAYKLTSERGVWLEYGTHLVDMMRALLGEPQRVTARLHHLNPAVRGESLAHAAYEYEQATAVIEVAWKALGALQAGVLVTGTAGEVYFEGTLTRGRASRLRLYQAGSLVLDEACSPDEDYVESFYAFERECTNAMLGRGAVTQTGAEHLQTLHSTFAAYAAATGQPMTLPPLSAV